MTIMTTTTAKMNRTGPSTQPVLKPASLKQWVRKLQTGTADDFGFLAYTTYIWFVLMMGLIFAFVGFYRIGANYANDYGVRIGALYRDDVVGETKQEQFLGQFTGNSVDCPDCYDTVSTERMAQGGFTAQSSIPAMFHIQGVSANFDIKAQSRVRLERFFPGPAKCNVSGDCFE